ncbi:dNTP triphosphohydrolase [Fusobacterium nucleatum]|nr:dNTP triphosphohydrolase [Fusobacterium nucleatum]MCG6841709.1 dNTP triphosphohydrolase [Fusobacterium nucleatum]
MVEDNSKEKVIPLKSSDLEEEFNKNIANYGYKKNISQSDEVEGAEETYRTNLRRQRDKILYTGGFRRLQDKTQVMSATISGDHRTRLTHTLEVEQIAISIANALKLNVDLVSAIALGHDVGHTPFGHAAERKLNELLENNGKFHHPIQSIRYIWEKYGSKIENEIYEGILLHDSDMFAINKKEAEEQLNYLKNLEDSTPFIKIIDGWLNEFPSTLEAQAVIWADKIAYITHDLEDFLRSPVYINLKKNNNNIENELCTILNELIIDKEIGVLEEFELRDLIRSIITDLILSSAENINSIENFKQKDVKNKTKERSYKSKDKSSKKIYLNSLIINFSECYRKGYYKLRELLDKYYIFSPEVQKSDLKAEIIVEWLFNTLKNNYKLMPLNIRAEIDETIKYELKNNNDFKKIYNNSFKEPKSVVQFEKYIEKYKDIYEKYYIIKDKIISRKVAAYIATMTDTYAESMYRNLVGSRVDFIL